MGTRTVACVMEQTLGSVSHYLTLRGQESAVRDCRLQWIPVEYRGGRLPWTITGSLLARRALRPVLDGLDSIFMHTTTLAPLAVDYFRRKPTVLSSDGTQLNKREMRAAYGLKPEGYTSEQAKRLFYREVFARARGFVAWSNWAKQSFVEDYGCRDEDVAVIPPGVDLDQFSSVRRNHELPRILFVGGDFVRKGGDLLLGIFRKRLRGRAELILATRAELSEEPGVKVLRNVQPNSAELHHLYRSADIFALPSRADCYSLVCMEALASGLPIVATPVGGIPDLVREGKTGHLVGVDDEQRLGDILEALVQDASLRQHMGAQSRLEAESSFDARENTRRLFAFVLARS
ncbi:MAG TPA: glycosyltransferase family 4 protein [Polyangiaceae bacterium]|nr:glycosyltransferase family 4 protein [Polyangiaceae bacterium]